MMPLFGQEVIVITCDIYVACQDSSEALQSTA